MTPSFTKLEAHVAAREVNVDLMTPSFTQLEAHVAAREMNVDFTTPSFNQLDAHVSRCAAHLEVAKPDANQFEPDAEVPPRGLSSRNTRRTRATPQVDHLEVLTQLMEEHLNSPRERSYNSGPIQAFLRQPTYAPAAVASQSVKCSPMPVSRTC
jgi:hypothetical protein